MQVPLPGIATRELADYVGISEARGEVYYLGDSSQPFLQLHLLPDAYTLLWPSAPNDHDLPAIIGGLVAAEAHELMHSATSGQGVVSLSAVINDGSSVVETQDQLLLSTDST